MTKEELEQFILPKGYKEEPYYLPLYREEKDIFIWLKKLTDYCQVEVKLVILESLGTFPEITFTELCISGEVQGNWYKFQSYAQQDLIKDFDQIEHNLYIAWNSLYA